VFFPLLPKLPRPEFTGDSPSQSTAGKPHLDEAVESYLAASISDNTKRAYAKDLVT